MNSYLENISPVRRFTILAVIGLVIGGSLFCILMDGEAWPFSQYPMYSKPREPLHSVIKIFGQTESGDVDLSDTQYWAPLTFGHFNVGMRRIQKMPDKDARCSAALSFLLPHYEKIRRQGKHAGPPIHGLKLFRNTYRMRPDLANRNQPEQEELLCEIRPAS